MIDTGPSRFRRLLRQGVVAYSVRNRQRKARLIGAFMDARGVKTVILVGVNGATTERNEDIVERRVESRARVVAAVNPEPACTAWPLVLGDGRALPLRAKAADLVLSNAVIEHVGTENDQRRFVSEHLRVGRYWVITTPNKWFPVESHTSVLFKHWSPGWRAERREFTRLLSRREFSALLPPGTKVSGRPWSPTFMAFSE